MHFQCNFFKEPPRDLDLTLDLDFHHVDFILSLEWPSLTYKALVLRFSMDFLLISSDNKDATTSSNLNTNCVVLPIATTKLSQEFGREHNKVPPS